jgi:hypothetical protein
VDSDPVVKYIVDAPVVYKFVLEQGVYRQYNLQVKEISINNYEQLVTFVCDVLLDASATDGPYIPHVKANGRLAEVTQVTLLKRKLVLDYLAPVPLPDGNVMDKMVY